jgi:DNA-binding IclR family transcriptional regulator
MNRTPRPPTGPSAPAVKGAALVGKALDLLNLIGEAAPISAADLTARTGWPRASVFRFLSALTAGGFARMVPR